MLSTLKYPKRGFLFVIALLMAGTSQAQTTATQAGSDGLWNTAANWTNGIPVAGGTATVNKALTVNTDISVGNGGLFTINSPITDNAGLPAYTLSISGGGGSNKGTLDINANATFEGVLNVNSNGQLIVEPGCTLTVGATVFANGSIVNVKAGGVLIVNGDLTNNNNSDQITINGTIIVNGDFSGGNGSAITGTGVVSTTGTMTNTGTGNVFGVGTTCNTGPCSTANFCGSNTITPTSTSICSGSAPGVITGSTLTGSYQWQSFSGTTGPWTNVTTLAAANKDYTPGALTTTTSYRRYFTNGGCTAYSSVVQIVVNSTPTITAQPTAQTSCVGSTATFSVTATGNNLTYQWRKNGSNVSSGTGGTTSSYTTPSLGILDGAFYSVVVTSGGCSSVTSNSVALVVTFAPSIVSQPASVSRCVGSTATFTVGALNGVSYQWQKNGVNVSGGSGGTTFSYTTPALTNADNGAVYTVIVNGSGSCTPLTSDGATLTVSTAPVITAQPTAQTSCVGSTATFTVTATGTNLTYQWRRNGTNVTTGTGGTTASFTTAALVTGDAGNYSVVVSSTGCTSATSNNAALTVNPTPAITAQPTAVTRCVGGTATFSVTATGTGLTYQWKRNGVNVSTGTGGTTASYTTAALVAGDNGAVYTVVVSSTGSCTPLTSNGATLTVNTAPAITAQPTAQTSCVGSTATFTVTATGTNLTYQWRKGGVDVSTGSGGTTASYTTAALVAGDNGGLYSVVVSNTGCTAATSGNATLTVNTAPVISTQPVAATTICVGSTATFSVATSAGTNITYQWRRNGVNIATGATSSSYTTPAAVAGDNNAQFSVVVSSAGCTSVTSSNAVLTVNTAPVISTHPSSATICVGSSAIFNVVISAGTNPTFQWKKNGANVGTNSFIHSTPVAVAADDNSQYTVEISSPGCPVAISNPATLTVNTAPVISTQPAATTVCLGASATFTVATSAGTNLTYQWRKNGANIVSGGTSSSYITPATVAGDNGALYSVVISTTGCASATSANAVLTINSTNQWNGSVSNNWSTSGNWSCNTVPNSSWDVVIPSSLGTYPLVTSGTTAITKNISLSSGASVTLEGTTSLLQVYGNWTNAGAFNAGIGTVEFVGSTATQTITNTASGTKEKFYKLTVNKSSGSVTIASSTSVDIIAGGTVQITNGTLDLNSRPFTLKSAVNRTYNDGIRTHSVDSTARLGSVTGTLSNASNFAIERYIYAPSAKPRLLSTSVASMPAAQWADSVSIFGGDFRLPAGFPSTTSTLYWYNEGASQGSLTRGFTAIVTKATVLWPGQGYRVIVGYDNNPVYTSPAKSSVTLKMRGVPQVGSLAHPIFKSGADPYGWNLVGNPYPCEISWSSLYTDNQTNVSPTVAIMDPRSGGTSDYYYYNAFTNLAIDPRYAGTGATAYTTTPRFNSDIISSSQGFYVFKTTAGTGTLNFSESHKAVNPGMVESNFRTASATTQYLNIGVLTQAGYTDNTYVFFSEDATAESFDILYDVYKLDNVNVNIMTNTFGSDMAMNGLNSKEGDVLIPLIVSTEAEGIHQLNIQGVESLEAGKEVYLIDEYTNSITALTETDHLYSFSFISGDSASTSRDRFILRVSNAEVTTGTTNATSKGTLAIYPNPATDMVTFSLTDAPGDTYHIEIVNTQGIQVYEENLVINGGTFALHNLDELLKTGVYVVKITSSGKSYIDKLIIK